MARGLADQLAGARAGDGQLVASVQAETPNLVGVPDLVGDPSRPLGGKEQADEPTAVAKSSSFINPHHELGCLTSLHRSGCSMAQ